MHSIGVDIGGTKIAAGVVDENGRIRARTRRDTPATDQDLIEGAVVDAVQELRADHEIAGVGIGAAGFVGADRRTIVFAANLAWRDAALADGIESRIDLPVVVENDANAAGWAEFRFGAAREAGDMLMLTVGTGLGGALVMDGRLVRGSGGFAGEVAHMNLVPNGQWCGCGRRGCLEQYTSGTALVRMARARAASSDALYAPLLSRAEGDIARIDGPTITDAAQEGDEGAIALLDELGYWLGYGAASLSAVLDPQMVVIGGGVGAAGDLLLDPARRGYAEELVARGHRSLAEFAIARTGNSAGMIGAADLARQAA
ncbi:glucokinase [Brachybacterium endophyticum]|uniref:Glucokinase n=1 Tax=Brachybacterium endophyticum TaxID=2182385 RepID=A0A2U2RJ49_9MICO|nr:ROK family glucokinase [Brachybacterium endophyticum]PWH05861.1 glucokinase [Brachybacterium endophyticum]